MAWSDAAKKQAVFVFETSLVDDGPIREQMQSRLLAALDAAAAVDGDAQWNAAIEAAVLAALTDKYLSLDANEKPDAFFDGRSNAKERIAAAIRSLKRLK